MQRRILLLLCSLLGCASTHSAVIFSTQLVGTLTNFPLTAFNNGSALCFSTVDNDIGAGGTILGGVQETNRFCCGGGGGEIFYWRGPNRSLTSIVLVETGGINPGVYRPFLFDLGFSDAPLYVTR